MRSRFYYVSGMKIDDLFDVDGKIAIVGGSRGIGYMISEGLLRNGVTSTSPPERPMIASRPHRN